MNQKELKELIEFLIEKDIAEFELERGDVKVRIKRGAEGHGVPDTRFITVHPAPPVMPELGSSPATAAPAAPEHAPKPAETKEDLHLIKSPIVGTYYESPSPGAPPFIKPGDTVETGQVLCIVEAMKLMNEIESDVSGEVVKILVTNGQPIEYGQDLFAIRARR
jgi:acetyl-CoA carboxylase biotin carboxyl carrier protein